jgi:hypothetical protein
VCHVASYHLIIHGYVIQAHHVVVWERIPKEALPRPEVPHAQVGPSLQIFGDPKSRNLRPTLPRFAVEGVVEVPLGWVIL